MAGLVQMFAAILTTNWFLSQTAVPTTVHIAIWRLSIANTPLSLKSTSITKPCSSKYERPWPAQMVRLASIWVKCSIV